VDIAILGNQSIKIKGKEATFIVDPMHDMPKTPADAVVLLNGSGNIDISRVADFRIVISGPGGYEVGGAKVSGTTTPKGTLYRFFIDGLTIILGKSSEAKAEGFSSCQVLVINTDDEFSESFVTSLEPKIVALYGDKKLESAKTLGAENIQKMTKLTTAKDKLPEKMEVVVLG